MNAIKEHTLGWQKPSRKEEWIGANHIMPMLSCAIVVISAGSDVDFFMYNTYSMSLLLYEVAKFMKRAGYLERMATKTFQFIP